MLKFLKNLFSTETEDILFAYRLGLPVGVLDGQGIEKYLKKNKGNKVFVFTEKKINKSVKRYFSTLENTRIIRTDKIRKEMKKWEEKSMFKDKKIKKVSLDNFGTRPIQRDAD